jgi:hypothetical protein
LQFAAYQQCIGLHISVLGGCAYAHITQ